MAVECGQCGERWSSIGEGASWEEECPRCRTDVGVTGLLEGARGRGSGGVVEGGRTLPTEALSASALPSNVFGRYIRVRRIGSGGMGEVWKAWDTDLSRWVALKFPRFELPRDLERLKREAKSAGKLAHPNLAAIYEFVHKNDRHFIAMQYVDGLTLADYPKQKRQEFVGFIRDAARGVSYAHSHGITHRDLKPANIMVERDHVYVMDFGIARIEAAGYTSTGVAGTPSYMPPEQAKGERVDGRGDVYALGATLYDMIANAPPFDGESDVDILQQVIHTEPRPLERVDTDLNTVVMKCLSKNPEQRYPTAKELAEDLDRWLRGEAILAHPPSLTYRIRKYLTRRKAIFASLTAALVLVALVIVALDWNRSAKTPPDGFASSLGDHEDSVPALQKALALSAENDELRIEIRHALATALLNRGLDYAAAGKLDLAQTDLEKALRLAPENWPHEARVKGVLRKIEK